MVLLQKRIDVIDRRVWLLFGDVVAAIGDLDDADVGGVPAQRIVQPN
jgi:hypothetical protein